MYQLAIVSHDHKTYEDLFRSSPVLQKHFSLIYSGISIDESLSKQCQILLSDPKSVSKYLDSFEQLKWLQSTWAGNNLLQQNTKRDYQLTGVKNVFGAQMTEYVLTYILHFMRKVEQFQYFQREKNYKALEVETMGSKKIIIFGLGNIGEYVARQLCHLGATVVGVVRNKKKIKSNDEYNSPFNILTFDQIEEDLKDSDFVINLLPETDLTIGLFDSVFFSKCKTGSVFINAGRGNVVDKPESLVDALDSGKFTAAVLDVFETEPLNKQHIYYQTKNIYITCHTAAVSKPEVVFNIFIDNALRFVDKKPLNYAHNFELGY